MELEQLLRFKENNNQQSQENTQSNNNQNSIPEFVLDLKAKALSGSVSPDDIKNILADQKKSEQFIQWITSVGFKDGNSLLLASQSLQQNSGNNQNTQQENNQQTVDNQQNANQNNQVPLDNQNHPKFKQFGKFLNPLGNRIKTKSDMEAVAKYFQDRANAMAQ